MNLKWINETEKECKIFMKDASVESKKNFNEKHSWFNKEVQVKNCKKKEECIEKCARCKNELGWKKMQCHDYLNEWLCKNCEDIFSKEFIEFKNQFIGNGNIYERKEEDENSEA